MTIQELEKIMIENGITIRAIPKEIVSYWYIQDKGIPNCKNEIGYNKRGRALKKIVNIPKNGGKFIIKSNCDNGDIISFRGLELEYFDSIEHAIKSIQEENN